MLRLLVCRFREAPLAHTLIGQSNASALKMTVLTLLRRNRGGQLMCDRVTRLVQATIDGRGIGGAGCAL